MASWGFEASKFGCSFHVEFRPNFDHWVYLVIFRLKSSKVCAERSSRRCLTIFHTLTGIANIWLVLHKNLLLNFVHFLHAKGPLFKKLRNSPFHAFYNGMNVLFSHNAFQQFAGYKRDPGRSCCSIFWWPWLAGELRRDAVATHLAPIIPNDGAN